MVQQLSKHELYGMIISRLVAEDVFFYCPPENLAQDKILDSFVKDMQSRHIATIRIYLKYCQPSFIKNFFTQEKVLKDSIDYTTFIYMIGGYNQAIDSILEGKHEYKENVYYTQKIMALFQAHELEAIANYAREIINNLEEDTAECYTWIQEHNVAIKPQMESLMDLVKAMHSNPLPTSNDAEAFKQYQAKMRPFTEKVLTMCLPKGDTSHNLYTTHTKEKFGLLPTQKLFTNIGYLLVFLDVLHYAGWSNTSRNADPQNIIFGR
jgi:hypothetical protein